jgi:hypothetical protein
VVPSISGFTPNTIRLRRARLVVSGWKSGTFLLRRPVALGIRVGRKNAAQFFEKDWGGVFIEMDGLTIPIRITRTFWSSCPELRNSAIGAWMKKRGLAPWMKGKPPQMRLTPTGGNRFRLDAV